MRAIADHRLRAENRLLLEVKVSAKEHAVQSRGYQVWICLLVFVEEDEPQLSG